MRILSACSLTLLLCFITYTIAAQTRNLHIEGSGDQFGVIQTTSTFGGSISGIELLRGNAFSGTDWRIINDNGTLKIADGTDNFSSSGDLNVSFSSSGALRIHNDLETSIGNYSGMLILGEEGMPNLSLDANEILARDGTSSADLYFQAGAGARNSYFNIASGNVGIGANIAPVRLSIMEGSDANINTGGYLLMGYESSDNLVLDNNEIMARDGQGPSTLLLQRNGGEVSIGTPSAEVDATLAIRDNGSQLQLSNSEETSNEWFIGASNPNWDIGGGRLMINSGGSSSNNMMLFNRNSDVVTIQRSDGDLLMCGEENGQVGIGIANVANMPDDEYLLAVDGAIIAEEVRVEMSVDWPDYVFKEEYDLLSLRQIEKYIEKNGHLPNIPSAEQVNSEGIDLGDMERRLLEKVEELTLHIITLEKRINQLESK